MPQNPEGSPVQEPLSETEMQKAKKIIDYVKTLRDFVLVYRAEGEKDLEYTHSSSGKAVVGSWFTPIFSRAKSYAVDRTRQGIPEVKIYAVMIPQETLDNRDSIDVGMSLVNVHPDFQNAKILVTEPKTTQPTSTAYLAQFDLIRRYAQLKNKTVAEVLLN